MNRREFFLGAGAITGAAALGALVPPFARDPKHKRFVDLRYTQMDPLEDAIVVERIQGSPERKVYIIEVGDIPKARIDAHLREVAREIACRTIA